MHYRNNPPNRIAYSQAEIDDLWRPWLDYHALYPHRSNQSFYGARVRYGLTVAAAPRRRPGALVRPPQLSEAPPEVLAAAIAPNPATDTDATPDTLAALWRAIRQEQRDRAQQRQEVNDVRLV